MTFSISCTWHLIKRENAPTTRHEICNTLYKLEKYAETKKHTKGK